MNIEFMGRVVHISTEHGGISLYPDEVFELVKWAKENEIGLFMRSRELAHIEERKQMRMHSLIQEENGDE